MLRVIKQNAFKSTNVNLRDGGSSDMTRESSQLKDKLIHLLHGGKHG